MHCAVEVPTMGISVFWVSSVRRHHRRAPLYIVRLSTRQFYCHDSAPVFLVRSLAPQVCIPCSLYYYPHMSIYIAVPWKKIKKIEQMCQFKYGKSRHSFTNPTHREIIRFFNSLLSIVWLLCPLEILPVMLCPFSWRSRIICVAWSISPFAIVMQCFNSRYELSGNISCNASHSSVKKSHVLILDEQSSAKSTGSACTVGFDSNFDSGIISDKRNDLLMVQKNSMSKSTK